MNLKKAMGVYKVFVGFAAWYTINKLLEERTTELVLEGDSATNAFLIGAGQSAISLAVGVFVANAIDMV